MTRRRGPQAPPPEVTADDTSPSPWLHGHPLRNAQEFAEGEMDHDTILDLLRQITAPRHRARELHRLAGEIEQLHGPQPLDRERLVEQP